MKATRAQSVEQLGFNLDEVLATAETVALPWLSVDLTLPERICPVCGGPVTSVKSFAKYCSPKCRYTAQGERKARKKNRPYKGDLATCAWAKCGRTFRLSAGHQKYCSTPCKNYAKMSFRTARQLREYRAKYPGFSSDVSSRRKARFFGTMAARFTSDDWAKTLRRQQFRCFYCGEKAEKFERDHVVPISRGGNHSESNIVAACVPCNRSKHQKLVSEWRYLEGRKAPLVDLMSPALKRHVAPNGIFRLREQRRDHPSTARVRR